MEEASRQVSVSFRPNRLNPKCSNPSLVPLLQDVMNSAAGTLMKLMVQSKMSGLMGTGGGAATGGAAGGGGAGGMLSSESS